MSLGARKMDAMEAILTRRSIRRYTSKRVPGELTTELLRAAMSAPSASNEQPWHFVVIDDRTILDEIPRFHPYSDMLPEAPMAILVCVELIPAAHAKGLGAVWLGIYPREERIEGMRKLTNLPNHIIPLALIALGYPAEKIPREDRYQPLRIHSNKW
jgi:nitroreductase